MIYTHQGKRYAFNDLVVMECVIGIPDERRIGRLVQVRKGVGQFGSDLYFIRLRDGGLVTFENVLMRRADDKQFEDAFYRLGQRREPPTIHPQPPFDGDSEQVEYTITNKWPETGFIIEKPKQPERLGAFAITVLQTKP